MGVTGDGDLHKEQACSHFLGSIVNVHAVMEDQRNNKDAGYRPNNHSSGTHRGSSSCELRRGILINSF